MDSQERELPTVSGMRLLRPLAKQSIRVFQYNGSHPQQEQAANRSEPVLSSCDLGRDIETDEIISIGDVERRSGLYILGKPGMGKTTLLVNLILQDIEHGHGLCFLDPAGDAIEDVLQRLPDHRKNDVILLDPLERKYAFGLNLFQCDDPSDPVQVSDTINTVLEVFAKLFTATGNFEDAPAMFDTLFSTIILLIYNPGYTLADVPLLLTNREASAKLIQNIPDSHEDVRQWWLEYNDPKLTKPDERNRRTGSTRRRLQLFLTNELVRHIVGQPTTINMQTIMDEGKILLVKLPRTQPQVTTLVGSLLVDRILHAAYAREAQPKRKRRHFCLYCDEFQNYATSDFAKLITEARKYHIATTIAHQERLSQFAKDDKNRGATMAAANTILFQLTVNDAGEFAPVYARKPEEARELVLKDEEFEKVVDEVIDGIEPVMTLTQNPFTHLLTAHSNPRIVQLVGGLKKLANALEIAQAETEQAGLDIQKVSQERVYQQTLGRFTYVATRQQLLQGKHLINELLSDIMRGTVAYGSHEMLDRLEEIAVTLRGFIGFAQGAVWETQSKYVDTSYTRYDRLGKQTVPSGYSLSRADWQETILDGATSQYLPDLAAAIVCELPTRYEEGTDKAVIVLGDNVATEKFTQARLLSNLQASEQEQDVGFSSENGWTWVHVTVPETIEGIDEFYTFPVELPKDKQQELLARRILLMRQSRILAQAETKRLNTFLSELAALCLALSSPEQQIFVPSGQYQPRTRQQITYLTHPRHALTIPRRPIADMVNEMTQELATLPRYTAFAKITEEINGKQVDSTYKFQPDDLPNEDDETVVKMRKHKIRANTIRSGYYTEREAVKQAMKARQDKLLQREVKKAQTTEEE
jgi:hypothetical protein